MHTTQKLLLTLALTAATLAAQNPTLLSVVNNMTQIPAGFPNSAIAQGSILLIYGTNMGASPTAPAVVNSASLPLPTTAGLDGTSITIAGSGTTVTAPIFYTSPLQVAAVMPSNAPIGTDTLTLTYNGKSGSIPVTVVQSAFGIASAVNLNANNLSGVSATAAVTFGNDQTQYVQTNYSAAPGDTLIVWGTGLGPITASDANLPPPGNVGSAPQVFVGGIASPSVTYWGRSPCCAGIDQIVFTVPQNAPLGCNVGIIVETTNGTTPIVSNGPTIALAATDGATCSDPTQFVPSSLLTTGVAKAVFVDVQQSVFVCPPGASCSSSTNSLGVARFFSATPAQLATVAPDVNVEPSYGSCYTGTVANSSSGGQLNLTPLNGGTTITLTPPSGPALTLTNQGGLFASNGSSTALPSGTWTFSNGAGGSDIGPLTFNFPVPQQITWTNQTAVYSGQINRANPLTIAWSGGDSNGYVDIEGNGSDPTGNYTVTFECSAPTSAQQFTVPPSILLAMPAGAGAQAAIGVSTFALPYTLGTIPGINAALNSSKFETTVPVVFQ